LTTTFRRGSDFRAYVQDSLAERNKAPAEGPGRLASFRARIAGLVEGRPGWTMVVRLRERLAAAAGALSGFAASAPAAPKDPPPKSAAETLRSRRAQARPARKLNLEESRREIEAVQARLDARPDEAAALRDPQEKPQDPQEKWAAELAREYRREFHPLEAARKPAPAAAMDNPTAADGAAAALFVAGKAAWRIGLFLDPAVRFVSAHSAPILKLAAVGIVIVGAAGFLAQWPQSGTSDEAGAFDAPARAPSAAPRPAWVEIQKPFHLFDLAAPQLAREKRLYSARRHNIGGGRGLSGGAHGFGGGHR